jgi:hypothetical protein
MKKLALTLGSVAMSFALSATAGASPENELRSDAAHAGKAAPQAARKPFWDQASAHPKHFHGDPKLLEHTRSNISAGKAHALAAKAEETRQKAAGPSAKPEEKQVAVQHTAGFAGAMKRLAAADARASLEPSAKKPSNEAVSDRAGSEMGDLKPSGSGGDRHSNAAARAVKNQIIANDFASAKHATKVGEHNAVVRADEKLHLNAGVAQQLTKGDQGDFGGAASSGLKLTVHATGPALGAHNNFSEAKAHVRADEALDRTSKAHVTPNTNKLFY